MYFHLSSPIPIAIPTHIMALANSAVDTIKGHLASIRRPVSIAVFATIRAAFR
jgi:hypothetical protein